MKIHKTYQVPQEYFDQHFEAFKKEFPGYYIDVASERQIKCSAEKAFEILYMRGQLSGNISANRGSDKGKNKSKLGRRGGSDSPQSDAVDSD